MMKMIAITLLTILLHSRCGSDDAVISPTTPRTADDLAVGTSSEPAILEAEVEGIGMATISGRMILVKLPANYTRNTVRLTYKATADVKKITPASGQEVPVRSDQVQTVCIQNDALGNCTLSYQLIIQSASTLKATLEPASRQLDVTRYLQPYGLTFQLANLNAQTGVTRRFQVRFVHKTTGYTYVGENYMVNDKTGNVVFINQPNVAIPDEGQLQMTGTLPDDMPTGTYAVSILVPTCYAPTADGRCASSGTEGIDLTEPFLLRPGLPLVGATSLVSAPANELLIKGRNFSTASPVPVRLSSDFTQPVDVTAPVETETIARLPLPTTLSIGQYRLDVSPVGGQPYSALFTVPGATAQPSFAYVALFGNYVATQNGLPALPVFKGGETLEVRYAGSSAPAARAMRLLNKEGKQVAELTGNTSFRPYAGATDFVMWKWVLPVGTPKGEYALAFEAADGTLSMPYYQKIRVN